MSNDLVCLPRVCLETVTGGFSAAKIKSIESAAVKFAERTLKTAPVFLGDVTNSVKQKIFNAKGVLVSTGDEADPQFYVGRVGITKAGKPNKLTDL